MIFDPNQSEQSFYLLIQNVCPWYLKFFFIFIIKVFFDGFFFLLNIETVAIFYFKIQSNQTHSCFFLSHLFRSFMTGRKNDRDLMNNNQKWLFSPVSGLFCLILKISTVLFIVMTLLTSIFPRRNYLNCFSHRVLIMFHLEII